MNKSLLVFVILFSFDLLFCDETADKYKDIDRTINYSAQPVEHPGKECFPLVESYKKHVFEARYVIDIDKEKYAASHYMHHLECWNDPVIYAELAEHYKRHGKLYLAGLTYKKAGMMNEYNEAKKLKESIGENDFQMLARKESLRYTKRYNSLKIGSSAFLVLGPLTALTGLVVLLRNADHQIMNSNALPILLMLGGLSITGGGVLFNLNAANSYNIASSYLRIIEIYSGDNGTLPSEYYQYSGFDRETKKMSAKNYQSHGAALIALSAPLLAVAVYGFFESYKNSYDSENGGHTAVKLTHLFQLLTLAPGIVSMTGGIIMLVKASKYEKLSTEPSLFTLDSITPVINPVSRTYGLALGFLF